MYTPIQVKSGYAPREQTTLMAKKGLNLRESPQLLNLDYALEIKNYIISSEGVLEKRKGLKELFSVAGSNPGYLLEKFDDNHYIYAYDKYVSIYDKLADSSATIKTYGASSTTYSGQRYGNYFFVTNGKDKLQRIARILKYDAVTKAFTKGEIATGGTSSATGIVLEDIADYTPAYLTGGTGATAVVATWQSVTDGSFKITIDGTLYTIKEIDFSSVTTMDDVASTIQTAIRNATESTETCVWSTDHFIIHSVDETSSSAITETSTTAGTDISGGGATAYMDADVVHGTITSAVKLTTGTLVLGNISGTFQYNEAITDGKGGSATVDGVLDWQSWSIKDAPIGQVLRVIANRLYIGNLNDDETAVAYSGTDDGTNPPFTTWTVGTLATSPGRLYYRSAGEVKAVESLGSHVVILAENGKWAFKITTIDSGGMLTKIDDTSIQRIDTGGSSGALTIPQGLFYISHGGLWQLLAIGSDQLPTSTQEQLTSVLLGSDYFDDITLTNADMVYSQKYNSIFITVADDSSKNNKVIVYNLDYKAFSEITGWNINRFLNDNGTIYGISANETKVYQCFKTDNDDGSDITTSYKQEISSGGLNTIKQLDGVYLHGFLSQSSSIKVRFDIYDRKGVKVADKLQYTWTPDGSTGSISGHGTAVFGKSSWGGDEDSVGLVESFSGGKARIKNFQRIRVHLTEQSKVNHKVTYLSVISREKSIIRRRNLTKI